VPNIRISRPVNENEGSHAVGSVASGRLIMPNASCLPLARSASTSADAGIDYERRSTAGNVREESRFGVRKPACRWPRSQAAEGKSLGLIARLSPTPSAISRQLDNTDLLLLSRIGQASAVVPDVVAAILVFAAGMALFTAPLATVTFSPLHEGEQGVASGMNKAMGQLAGLLGVAILPAIAGLAGVGFGDPAFAAGYARALGAAAPIAFACIPIAAWSFPAWAPAAERL
jgi:hypothetical protein